MFIEVLIAVTILSNLITVGLVFLVLKNSQKVRDSVTSSKQSFEETQKQIDTLQNQFKNSLQEMISKDSLLIQNTSNSIIQYYQDSINTLTSNYNQNSQKLIQALNDQLKVRVEELAKVSALQVEESKKAVNAQVAKDLDELRKKLDQYANSKYKEVDTKIYQIITETAKNTVGKVINIVDHQELVMSALEQAKKDKFFS